MTEMRNDDILQTTNFSSSQKRRFRIKSPFQYFLKADQAFEAYNYPCTLAVLAEGIGECQDWVDYIKRNQHRYKIELHGSSHLKYVRMTEEQGEKDLKEAIDKIEETFKTEITTWYVPFGRGNIPEWGERVCERLGIKIDIPTMKQLPDFWGKEPKREQINFHYWDESQVNKINRIIKCLTSS